MKDRALALALSFPQKQRKNVLREYMQANILYSIQQSGAFQYIAFQGGTALRFLYSIKRFSEDLDFAIEKKEGFDFRKMKEKILKDLQYGGFQVTIHEKKPKTVKVLSVRVSEVLFKAQVSRRENENLDIHVDIDTNPPSGAHFMTTLINHHFVLSLRNDDLAFSVAGKLHAVIMRPYVKGRDLYDLLWYLTNVQKVAPNILFLNNALKQTGWKGAGMTEENWKKELFAHISKFNWEEIVRDVSSFLEVPSEAKFLELKTFEGLLH